MTLLEAIAREEGFYHVGSRPARNHNPGDIEFGSFALAHGATEGDPRFAIFPDDASGFRAMQALLSGRRYLGRTIEAALNMWAPPVENKTNAYIDFVCKKTGLVPSTIITLELLQLPSHI